MRKPPSQNSARVPSAPGHVLSRRAVIVGLPLLAAGCAGGGMFSGADYGAIQDGGFILTPVDLTSIDPGLTRQEVAWKGKEKPGSIVVNVPQRRLYLVQKGGRALRYGVGVGRAEGVNFRGLAVIGRKEKWPHWTPTANMMAAMPEYRPFRAGLDGGVDNPLGARALYLYRDGRDTLFRLHGTTEPETIGQAVSSGCIRLFNQDIIDLYDRVKVGTHVTVVQG
ncbi:MAG: L,D-transpeptidase [Deltaproteobacteria bacterium]|nr:L,D-transpeptidase [Deltaproteobacteria bacterium]